MSTFKITDANCIDRIEIPYPEAGGVVVLHGNHGVGKTTAINATAAIAGAGSCAKEASPNPGDIRFNARANVEKCFE